MVTVEGSKCIKFENYLCSKIKQGISYQKIRQFPELVNRCRIYDEDNRARVSHYKSLSEKKGNLRHKGTPYSAPADKGKQKVVEGKKPSRGGTSPNLSNALSVVALVTVLTSSRLI